MAPAGGLGRHHQHGVVTGDRPDHPGEPAPVERRAYDMGGPGRRPEHDEVARMVGLDHPLPQHPAQVVLGGDLVGRAVRARRRPCPHREVGPSRRPAPPGPGTRWSGWRRSRRRRAAPPGGPGCRPRSASSSLVIRCWRWCLVTRVTARHPARSPRPAGPRMACIRLAACCQTTLRAPSTTAALISSPRWAGRQWSTTASGARPGHQGLVDAKPAKAASRASALVLLAHRRPHIGVEGAGAVGGGSAGSSVTIRSPPKERTRATSSAERSVAVGRRHPRGDPGHGGGQGERAPDVVGVADVGDGPVAGTDDAETLAEGQQVGAGPGTGGPGRTAG